jgi:hypothetical protein
LHGAAAAYFCGTLVGAATTMALAIRVGQARPEWGRILRIALCAALAGAMVLPLRGRGLPLVSILLGGALLGSVYLLLTLLLRCWSAGDIAHLQQLHQRFIAGHPRSGARFLEWARRHASQPGSG